ncbi:hypothetical protein GGR54DRAFT_634568 [Hypoxylon sp. NC1633]|nr:hypothetical protein GGR54DRAFT_634568 [Hypoxylon sp. NC1633]
MRGLWRCSSCVGLMVLAVLAAVSQAAHDNEYQIHQLEKNHHLLRHPKREASCQVSGYSLCPDSAGGGCCPDNYACAASYCYATTAGPTSACGKANWYDCPLTAGAGSCCPVGYICDPQSCAPPAGVPVSQSCGASYFACPASLGYGCCPNGMACGSVSCYATTPQTFLVSDTVTTTNSGRHTITTIVTSTVVTTPGPDVSLSTSATAAGVPKLIPSTVSKIPAVETGYSDGNSGGGGGLTQAQLGGIVGGAVAFLIIIITIAGIVLWRLKKTEKAANAAAESKHDGSSDHPRSQKSGFGHPTVSEIDGSTDVDSIALVRHPYYRARSDSSTAGELSPSLTPNLYGSNASTTPTAWPGFPVQLPGSDVSEGRQSSLDNYGSYPPRTSVESQGSHVHVHSRQWSNASELDAGNVVPELESPDAGEAARRRSGSVPRASTTQPRRTSDPTGNLRGARGDGAGAGAPLTTLSEVNELHGHYGPEDLAVGQTGAKLNTKNPSTDSASGA